MKECAGGVTAAKGFTAAGVRCDIKEGESTKKDLALIVSQYPATAAAMFTKNQFKAAPVLFEQEQLRTSSTMSAVVVNSGNANACTGERGLQDCRTEARKAADVLNIKPEEIFVCSTGVIGRFLPIEKICIGIQM